MRRCCDLHAQANNDCYRMQLAVQSAVSSEFTDNADNGVARCSAVWPDFVGVQRPLLYTDHEIIYMLAAVLFSLIFRSVIFLIHIVLPLCFFNVHGSMSLIAYIVWLLFSYWVTALLFLWGYVGYITSVCCMLLFARLSNLTDTESTVLRLRWQTGVCQMVRECDIEGVEPFSFPYLLTYLLTTTWWLVREAENNWLAWTFS